MLNRHGLTVGQHRNMVFYCAGLTVQQAGAKDRSLVNLKVKAKGLKISSQFLVASEQNLQAFTTGRNRLSAELMTER